MKKTAFILMAATATVMSCVRFSNGAGNFTGSYMTCNEVVESAEEASRKGFSRITVSGACDVHYTQGSKCSVTLRGDTAGIACMRIECDGRTLKLSQKASYGKSSGNRNDVDVYVTSPVLTAVDISGAADMDMKGRIKVDDFDVDISGAANLDIDDMTGSNLDVDVSGAGDLDMGRITFTYAGISLSGASNCSTSSLKGGDLKLSASGASDADLDGVDVNNAYCRASGASDIDINGSVKHLEKSASGASSVNVRH